MNTFVLSPVPLKYDCASMKGRLAGVGGNPGNLVFMDALKQQVLYNDEIDLTFNQFDLLKDSSVVMPSSNFIRHVKNDDFFTKYSNFIDQIDGNVTLAGLGAQSSAVFNTPWKLVKLALNKDQIRFLKKISEKSVTIGVRGPFTAECLELLGIRNYRIIGCPSLFKYLDGVYPDVKKPSLEGGVQMTVTPGSRLKTKVLDDGINWNCFWVKQCVNEIPKTICFNGKKFLSPKWKMKNFFGLKSDSSRIMKYSEESSFLFWDINSWNEFYKEKNISFAFGTRFHGNMEALRNGVPALWITHDSRTSELTEFLHLPTIHIKEYQKIKKIEELFDYCDFTDLRKNYKKLCENYVSFLNENKISNKFMI